MFVQQIWINVPQFPPSVDDSRKRLLAHLGVTTMPQRCQQGLPPAGRYKKVGPVEP